MGRAFERKCTISLVHVANRKHPPISHNVFHCILSCIVLYVVTPASAVPFIVYCALRSSPDAGEALGIPLRWVLLPGEKYLMKILFCIAYRCPAERLCSKLFCSYCCADHRIKAHIYSRYYMPRSRVRASKYQPLCVHNSLFAVCVLQTVLLDDVRRRSCCTYFFPGRS